MRSAEIRVRVKGTGQYLPLSAAPAARPLASAAADARPMAPPPAHHGASTGRRLGGWRPTGSGPNAIVAADAPDLIRRSRDLVRNHPTARRAVSLFRAHIVGTGVVPRSLCPDPAVRERLHALWNRWTDHADADGAYDFYGLQAAAVAELVEGGEAFARLRPRLLSDGLPVPLQLQLIPAEQVPLSHAVPGSVVQGIERDAMGRRTAYWMHRAHPGDASVVTGAESWQLARVPAGDVCHLRLAAAGQLRGLPWLSTALTTLHQLGLWKDAALQRKQLVTMLVGFVKRGVVGEMSPEDLAAVWGEVTRQSGGLPAVALEPGTMQYLEPGEEVDFTDWKETSGEDEVFERAGLRAVAAGLDLIYEELSGDWNGVNDRTYRAAFATLKRVMRQHQHHLLVFQFCRPVWQRFIDQAVVSRALVVPAGLSDADLKAAEWRPERWEYLNPKQDIEAVSAEIDAGLTSREAVVAERGDDVETVDEQRARDRAREQRLTLTQARPRFTPDPPTPQQDQ